MQWLGVFIASILAWWVDAQTNILQSFGVWVFDQILGVVDAMIRLLPASTISAMPSLASLPADVLCVASACGLPGAIGLIVTAIAIRIPLSFVWRG